MKKSSGFSIVLLIIAIVLFDICIMVELNGKRDQVTALSNKIREMEQELKNKSADHDMAVIFGYSMGYIKSNNPQGRTDELPEFAKLTVQYADEFKVDRFEIMYICQIENGFDLYRVGTSGEQGPAQLMKSTWELYYKQLGYTMADFNDWRCNYRAAVAFYADLKKQTGGDIQSAIGYYNGGGRWREKKSTQRHLTRYMSASRGGKLLRGGIR
jgi:hypothetical protein